MFGMSLAVSRFFGCCPVGPLDLLDPAVERGGNGVPEMEEGIFFQADVDKHRLEAGLDIFDPALVDAAGDVAGAVAFNAIFLEPAVLEQGDAALEFFDADDEFVAGLATQAKNPFHLFYHSNANCSKSSRSVRF